MYGNVFCDSSSVQALAFLESLKSPVKRVGGPSISLGLTQRWLLSIEQSRDVLCLCLRRSRSNPKPFRAFERVRQDTRYPWREALVRLDKQENKTIDNSPDYLEVLVMVVIAVSSWRISDMVSCPSQVLGHIFNFQEASVRNQRDNATSMLSSRLSR